jgi:nucleoside-diphosphate-sugar epimerase
VKVLITGASGFLGRYTVMSAVAAGHQVRALVRPGTAVPAGWPAEVEVVRGDVGDLRSLKAAVHGQDAVAHLAAMVGGGDADQFAVTVSGTERLLAALEGSTVSRVVLASSFSVYDWGAPSEVLDESTPVESRWWRRDGYAASKVWQERIVREASEVASWDLVVLRPGFIWGPEKPDCPGVGEVVGSRMIVIGWRTPLPLTWVENCAEAFVLALTADVPGGTTVNIVDDDTVTTRQYAAASTRALGHSGRVVVPYGVARAVSHLARGTSRVLFREQGGRLPSVLDPDKFEARFRPLRFPNDRAKSLLGWSPRVSWRQASARAFQRA